MNAKRQEFASPLEGAHNFRDIGGYPTLYGRSVVRGKVFRSGAMDELTDRDQAAFRTLGIRYICDFRSTHERSKRPSRLPADLALDIWFRDHEMSVGDLTKAIAAPGASAEATRRMMTDLYRSLVYEQADSYRELFHRLARGNLPIVFHCAGGKDRTGIAAALLLDVLGVTRETVVADYVLTDQYLARAYALVGKDPFSSTVAGVDDAIWAPMMRADRAYIEAMFETVEARHGSAEGFLREALGLEDGSVAQLRKRLLA